MIKVAATRKRACALCCLLALSLEWVTSGAPKDAKNLSRARKETDTRTPWHESSHSPRSRPPESSRPLKTMKFCKNLQRVVDISDPEWAPYWTNYKMLKKLIKELPALVPSDDAAKTATVNHQLKVATPQRDRVDSPSSLESSVSSAFSSAKGRQHHGDKTAEGSIRERSGHTPSSDAQATSAQTRQDVDAIEKSPGEVAFFKLLHAELKKTTHFFERAQQEFGIREERVREGMEIMKRPNAIMVNEKWSLLAKSIYKLYKDLLLLETFAIMTYCSFSKILKKHDKVTGYNTRNAFMANVVNKANFTNYPRVLEMIARCEDLYEKVSERLLQEGKDSLYEDERLFINMIHRLNEQVLDNEGVTQENRKEGRRAAVRISTPATGAESTATSSLRSLVEENDAKRAAQIAVNHTGDDSDDGDPSKESDVEEPQCKRQRKEI